MWNTDFLEDGCGSGLPHGQHTVYTDDNSVRWLCEGKLKSDYEHCGKPDNHTQHRTGPDEKGPYCLGAMSIEEKARHFSLPITRLLPFELLALLKGETISVLDGEGRELILAKHTPDTLMEAHDKAREQESNPDLLPPRMTQEQAVALTKGL